MEHRRPGCRTRAVAKAALGFAPANLASSPDRLSTSYRESRQFFSIANHGEYEFEPFRELAQAGVQACVRIGDCSRREFELACIVYKFIRLYADRYNCLLCCDMYMPHACHVHLVAHCFEIGTRVCRGKLEAGGLAILLSLSRDGTRVASRKRHTVVSMAIGGLNRDAKDEQQQQQTRRAQDTREEARENDRTSPIRLLTHTNEHALSTCMCVYPSCVLTVMDSECT
jgi:hypothetical protein